MSVPVHKGEPGGEFSEMTPVYPSAVLRDTAQEDRHAMMEQLISDARILSLQCACQIEQLARPLWVGRGVGLAHGAAGLCAQPLGQSFGNVAFL